SSSSERDRAAERVERLELRARDGRAIELVPEQREDDGIASCFTLATGKPAAQRRLLREAERTRDAQARLVGGVDPDLDAVDAADADRDPRERGRRFARIAATDRRGADPVADLERSLAGARVEPRAADGLAFVAREDAVDEILPEIEPSPKAPQEPDPLVERPGLVVCPRHPGTEVVEAGVDRVREERRIARLPAAEHEPLRADQVRGRWVVDARQGRDATSHAPSLTGATTRRTLGSTCRAGYVRPSPVRAPRPRAGGLGAASCSESSRRSTSSSRPR